MKAILIILIIILMMFSSLEQLYKKFKIYRYIPNFDSYSEEVFFSYNCTLDFTDDGIYYVFDTASFYTWKNIPTDSESNSDNEIQIPNKYNETLKGEIKLFSNDLYYISLKTSNISVNFGSISIPIKIPKNIQNKIGKNNKDSEKRFYNYLDLIKDEIGENYINYIQDSLHSGYILFGEEDKIFKRNNNKRDIKTCKCSLPPDDDSENDFLNYWNCKINYFSVNNIKISSKYSISINGDIYAIFALSEEYIIAPKNTGEEIINHYKNLIGENNCFLETFKSNTKRMVCKKMNFAELPDFTITLEGEISLIALSFDLFKNRDENHIFFKILLNELDTKEYWYIGDPIIKNYNFLFNYTKEGNETITIVSSDKYNSFSIILTSIGASIITFIYFFFLLFARIRINILSKEKKKNQNEKIRRTTKKIKKIIRNQNDFDIPEGNIPIQNMIKNSNLLNEEDSRDSKVIEGKSNEEIELKIFKNGESDSNSISSSNIDNSSISKSFGNEKDFEKKIQKLKEKNDGKLNSNEYEMEDLNNINNFNSSDEGECEMIGEDEGSLPPLNKVK